MADPITDFIIKPAAPFAAGIVLFGVVWGFFKGVESVLNDDTKLKIAVWLLGVKVGQKLEPWPDTFAKIFEHVFGSKHLSWRCFLLTCCFSWGLPIIARSLIFGNGWTIKLDEVPTLLGILFVSNCLPAYVSLLKSRILLRLMGRTRAGLKWSLLVVLDFVLSVLIAGIGLLLVFGVSGMIDNGQWHWTIPLDRATISELTNAVLWRSYDPYGIGAFTSVVFFYPSFFTSIWLWLYAGSGFLLKFARRFDSFFQWFNSKADIARKPLSAIGLVAGCIVAVLWWTVVLVRWVV
jgi:hypothetical protein